MKKRPSSVVTVLETLWDNSMKATAYSWTRLNTGMFVAVKNMIDMGIAFEASDFTAMSKEFGGSHWMSPEIWYSHACEVSNTKCCQAIETYMGRPAYIFHGERLCVGSYFQWQGLRAKVTSINGAGLVACTYNSRPTSLDGPTKIDKRFTITRDDLKAAERGEKSGINPDRLRIERLIVWTRRTGEGIFCRRAKSDLIGNYGTLKEAFLKHTNGEPIHKVLEWLWGHGDIDYHKPPDISKCWRADAIRAVVEWDRDVLPYVAKILDRTKFVSAKAQETVPELVEA